MRQEQQKQKKQMDKSILDILGKLEEEPERIAGFLEFGSRFYQYSLKNNLLIYRENPQAAYCQSFPAWNEAGYHVKKGAKGIQVYVPYQETLLKIDGNLVPFDQASKEEKARYQAGGIEGVMQQRHDGVKTVFDIAQTTCPVVARKKFYWEGYPEQMYPQVVKGLLGYVGQLPEVQGDLTGALGDKTGERAISELAYRISHVVSGMEHLGGDGETKFQEAAFGMILENHMGITSTEERKERLASYWRELKEADPEQSLFTVLNQTYKLCRKKIPEIQEKLNLYLESPRMEGSVKDPQGQKKLKISKEELMSEIKNQVQITDYAKDHGFTLIRKGRYYTLAQHDSVRIDTGKNCYWRNSMPGRTGVGKGDSIIGFAAEFVHNGDLHEALKDLTGRIHIPEHYTPKPKGRTEEKQPVGQERELRLPERGKNMRRVFAYLTKSRYITPEIVQDFVDRKMLYQDVKRNCVFVAYDPEGKPNFASIRGTRFDVRFLGDVKGCDYKKGFYIDNHSKKLIVTESVIDAMSVMSILEAQGKDWKAYDYLPLGGAGKYEPLLSRLKADPKEEILLAEDHDLSGVKSMQLIKERLMAETGMGEGQIRFHVPENAKDWNQKLTDCAKKLKPISEIPFLEKEGLPEIHYCAIQSTEHTEEKGFRVRDGRHQYRLVELDAEGQVTPVPLTKQNTMFFTPEDVEKRIPHMYQKIPYGELLERQELIRTGTLGAPQEPKTQVQDKEKQHPETAPQNAGAAEQAATGQATGKTEPGIALKGFFKGDDELLMARIRYKGKDLEEAVWKEKGKIHIDTGMAYDNTLEEHLFTEEQIAQMETFLKENHYELDETYPILQLKGCGTNLEQMAAHREQYLNKLQQQEFDRNQQISQTPMMGMEL